MALSEKVNVQATETSADVKAPATDAPKTAKTGGKAEAFRQKGEAIRANLTPEQRDLEGSKKDKIAFICTLGNPAKPQPRKEKNENLPSHQVVGYKLKVLEDMLVPHAPLKENFETLIDTEAITDVPVKAGTVISLNLVETGALISQPQFAGQFTGEGVEVTLTAKTSKDRPDPLPALRLNQSSGSIKDNMELVADMIGATDTDKGKPQVKEEYADIFGVLFRRKSAGGKRSATGTPKAKGETAANLAAAFNALYASKRA